MFLVRLSDQKFVTELAALFNELLIHLTSVAELTFATRLRRTQKANVNSKSNTRINQLLVFLMVRTFALGRTEKGGKCLNRNTSGRGCSRLFAGMAARSLPETREIDRNSWRSGQFYSRALEPRSVPRRRMYIDGGTARFGYGPFADLTAVSQGTADPGNAG